MNDIKGIELIPRHAVYPFEIKDVFYEYDVQPLIFTLATPMGQLMLAHFLDENDDGTYTYLFSAVSEKILNSLKRNVLSLRSAMFSQGVVWKVILDDCFKAVSVAGIDKTEIDTSIISSFMLDREE